MEKLFHVTTLSKISLYTEVSHNLVRFNSFSKGYVLHAKTCQCIRFHHNIYRELQSHIYVELDRQTDGRA